MDSESAEDVLATQFRLHMHRGIGYPAADKRLRSIADLVERAVSTLNSDLLSA